MPYGRFRGMKPDFPQHNKTCVWRKQQHFLFRDSKDFASDTDFYFSPSGVQQQDIVESFPVVTPVPLCCLH